MSRRTSRRQFIQQSAAGLAGLAGLHRLPGPFLARDPRIASGYPANDKLRIGAIGVANRAGDNINGVAHHDLVALCDVDSSYLEAAAARFPAAKTFRDFRKLIDAGGLDAVVISTTDHVHAPATAAAIRAGLHVYCEKPLTHSVYEARFVTDLARKASVATQMGTQIHSLPNYRRVVELIRAGAIGEIAEVHVWVGGGYSGGERPAETPPVPAQLDWDLWLGPAPERPYHPAYAPFSWRGWWDFANGTLGDMACHHMDLPFWALDLAHPVSVEAEGPPVHAEACPPWLVVHYVMQRRDGGTVPLHWHHGDRRPRQFAEGLLPQWGNGTLFVGAKGMLIADYERYALLPEADFAGFVAPPPSIPDSIGHYEEWIAAIRGGAKALCDFSYSGPLTEAVLLGAVAYRSGRKLAWDPAKLATGDPVADAFLRREYRKGWTL